MRRIAVINQKGGVGKTTTTANLGAALARAGQRVLLVDLDPQAHLSLHYGTEVDDRQPTVYDVLTASVSVDDVALHVRDNVTLIPSDIDLAGAEAELVSVMGREVILREALDAYEKPHDVMLIDCPPSLGILTVNALVATSEVIIPLQAHFFALQGIGKLFDTVTLVRQRINPTLAVSGIVLCMHDASTRLAGEVVDDLVGFLRESRGTDVPWADARVYESRIRRNIKLAESCGYGQTVFDYEPRSNGAIDYAALASEIFGVPNMASRKASSPASSMPKPPPPVPPAPADNAPPPLEKQSESPVTAPRPELGTPPALTSTPPTPRDIHPDERPEQPSSDVVETARSAD